MALILDTRSIASSSAAGWLLLRAPTPTSRRLRLRSRQGHPVHLAQMDLFVFEVSLADAAAVSVSRPFGMEVCHSEDFIQQLLPYGNFLHGLLRPFLEAKTHLF